MLKNTQFSKNMCRQDASCFMVQCLWQCRPHTPRSVCWNFSPFYLSASSLELGCKHQTEPGLKKSCLTVFRHGCWTVQVPRVSQLQPEILLLPVRHASAWWCCVLLVLRDTLRCWLTFVHFCYSVWIKVLCSASQASQRTRGCPNTVNSIYCGCSSGTSFQCKSCTQTQGSCSLALCIRSTVLCVCLCACTVYTKCLNI